MIGLYLQVYQIQIGTDAETIVLEVPIQITGTTAIKPVFSLKFTSSLCCGISSSIMKKYALAILLW